MPAAHGILDFKPVRPDANGQLAVLMPDDHAEFMLQHLQIIAPDLVAAFLPARARTP